MWDKSRFTKKGVTAVKKKKRSFGISIGSSSILLCLTTFATLSLGSANADYRLSRKTADAAAAYYALDAAGEELLSDLAAVLEKARPELEADEAAYRQRLETALQSFVSPQLWEAGVALSVSPQGRWVLSCGVCQDDGWRLRIELDITDRYLGRQDGAALKRLRWQALAPGEQTEDAAPPLLGPGNLPIG